MIKDNISKLIEEKDYESAKTIILNDCSDFENDSELLKYLGLCNINLGAFNEALDNFEKILERNPDDATALYYLSVINIEKADFNQAETFLNRVIELRPEYIDAYKSLIICFIKQKKFDEVIQLKDKMLNIAPEDAKIYDLISVAYLEKKDFDNAIEMLSKAKDIEPDTYTYNLACAYDLAGKTDEAVEIIERLLTFNINSIPLKIHLALLYTKKQMYESAQLLYAGIINSGFTNRKILYEYAILCAKCNETDKTEEILKKLIVANPDFAAAYKDLGVIYLSRRFFDKALTNFKKAFELAPEDENIIYEFGNYYYVMSQFEDAKKMYSLLLEKDNLSVGMMINIAVNYMSMNEVACAKELLLKAVKAEPQNAKVLYNLAQIYFYEKNYENAKQLLEDTYMYSPDKEVSNLLAKVYMELGQYNEAYALFNIVYLCAVNNVDVLYNMAQCKFRQNDYEKAKEHINDIFKILPEHEGAQELLNLIDEKEIK